VSPNFLFPQDWGAQGVDLEMIDPDKQSALKELQQIPGVGKAIARDLYALGFRSARELQGRDPEELYLKLCAQKGMPVDRCMLYVFRCAVYYASNKVHNPELLKWWNWGG
jgi:hypothetical protein